MVLVDKKILSGGVLMVIAGIMFALISADQPLGYAGMTEDEIIELLVAEDENQAFKILSGILIGIGFLLILISFGARRKKKEGIKRKEKKPAE